MACNMCRGCCAVVCTAARHLGPKPRDWCYVESMIPADILLPVFASKPGCNDLMQPIIGLLDAFQRFSLCHEYLYIEFDNISEAMYASPYTPSSHQP